MRPLIGADELIRLLRDDAAPVRILDVRFRLADTEAGRRAYREAHVPGSVYLHLDEDLSGSVGRHGGRHPLPDPEALARRLGEAGVGDDTHVVVLDDGDGMAAGRAWWLLRWLGHDAVQVLDGGMPAYLAAGGEVTDAPAQPPPAALTARPRHHLVVDRDWVRRHGRDPGVALVDVRAPERYRGEVEPIDPVAGHVPGALNLPYLDNLEDGRFRSPEALAERHRMLEDADRVVLYCGSGVSAAQAALAMAVAGAPEPILYAGSWSDWVSHDEAPVAVGAEPG